MKVNSGFAIIIDPVIPAKAGIHSYYEKAKNFVFPAFVGMTCAMFILFFLAACSSQVVQKQSVSSQKEADSIQAVMVFIDSQYDFLTQNGKLPVLHLKVSDQVPTPIGNPRPLPQVRKHLGMLANAFMQNDSFYKDHTLFLLTEDEHFDWEWNKEHALSKTVYNPEFEKFPSHCEYGSKGQRTIEEITQFIPYEDALVFKNYSVHQHKRNVHGKPHGHTYSNDTVRLAVDEAILMQKPIIIKKQHYNAFTAPAMTQVIHAASEKFEGKTVVVISGVATDICVKAFTDNLVAFWEKIDKSLNIIIAYDAIEGIFPTEIKQTIAKWRQTNRITFASTQEIVQATKTGTLYQLFQARFFEDPKAFTKYLTSLDHTIKSTIY